MVWYGMVWCGVVWCDVAWCGVVWCGAVWCAVVLTWNLLYLLMRAFWMVLIWVEITESTEISIRLNSSKQPQAPHWHRPE